MSTKNDRVQILITTDAFQYVRDVVLSISTDVSCSLISNTHQYVLPKTTMRNAKIKTHVGIINDKMSILISDHVLVVIMMILVLVVIIVKLLTI